MYKYINRDEITINLAKMETKFCSETFYCWWTKSEKPYNKNLVQTMKMFRK